MSAKQSFWILVSENADVPNSGKRGAFFVYFSRAIAEKDKKYLKENGDKIEYRIKRATVKYK